MLVERRIRVQDSWEQVQEQIAAYLQQAGYKRDEAAPCLVFTRGSTLGSWTSFSPRNWQAKVMVGFAPAAAGPGGQEPGMGTSSAIVSIIIDVDTSGQIVIKRERDFWSQEVDGLLHAVQGEVIDSAVIPRSSKQLSWQGWLAVVGLALLGITIGIGVSVLLHAEYIGVVIGVGACVWALQRVLGVERNPRV